MKKQLKVSIVMIISMGIVISICLVRLFCSEKQENVDLINDSLSYKEESDIEKTECILQLDETESYHSNEQKVMNHTNIASYLQSELIWEMGDRKPVPTDFFQPEVIGIVKGLGEDETTQFAFVTPLTAEQMHTKGKYVVKIDCNGTVVDAHLSVVDTTPPVITVPEQMQYEIGETILYKKGVTITDNSGEDLKLMLDSSEVKSNMAGTYKVYYSAVDSSGNIGKAETEVIIKQGHQPTEEEVDVLADELLDSILTEGMPKLEQANTIFEWCYNHIRYTSDADKSSLVQGTYDGIHYRAGDCYTYFATATYLMNRCGIENFAVSKRLERATHYWSLVNLGEGWYHFDCSPHKGGFKCFMQTDAQVKEYAQQNEREADYFTFDETDMPNRAEEVIYTN